jgi:hypothetical protein
MNLSHQIINGTALKHLHARKLTSVINLQNNTLNHQLVKKESSACKATNLSHQIAVIYDTHNSTE